MYFCYQFSLLHYLETSRTEKVLQAQTLHGISMGCFYVSDIKRIWSGGQFNHGGEAKGMPSPRRKKKRVWKSIIKIVSAQNHLQSQYQFHLKFQIILENRLRSFRASRRVGNRLTKKLIQSREIQTQTPEPNVSPSYRKSGSFKT